MHWVKVVIFTSIFIFYFHLVRKEWPNLENMEVKSTSAEKEIFTKLRKANDQISLINHVLVERKNKKSTTTEEGEKPSQIQRQIRRRDIRLTKNCDEMSIDALEEFLGRLLDNTGDVDAVRQKQLTERDKYKIIMPKMMEGMKHYFIQ